MQNLSQALAGVRSSISVTTLNEVAFDTLEAPVEFMGGAHPCVCAWLGPGAPADVS